MKHKIDRLHKFLIKNGPDSQAVMRTGTILMMYLPLAK